jgi:superfamily II DNA or RNA helicase
MDENLFDETFIDLVNNKILNANLLSRRIQGLVSYFESYDPEDYPKLNETKIVNVPMSDDHFTKYMTVRQFEFEKELNSRIHRKSDKSKDDDSKSNTIFKTFSRAVCNYYFPDSIKRVYPSTLKNLRKEIDIIDEDDTGLNETEDETIDYKSEVKRMLNNLYAKKDLYLSGNGLKEHGPKYHKLYNNITKSIGPVLVYSQFRNVEGLKILELVLNANGYVQLDIKKNKGIWAFDIKEEDYLKPKYIIFTEEKDKNKILMDIYNSDFENVPNELKETLMKMVDDKKDKNLHGKLIKVIMITQSGAEGISLKNVRQVHIIEPYWNDIRIKQVIGRAVRAKSHVALPKDEREVDVFMYLAKFSKKQLEDSVVKSREKKSTSDQVILNIAKNKSNIMNELLNIMKMSAVDCPLHYNNCYTIPQNFNKLTNSDLIYYDSFDKDIKDNQIQTKKTVRVIKKKRNLLFLKSTKYTIPYYEDTSEALDPFEYENGNYVIIGKVENVNGKMKVVRI